MGIAAGVLTVASLIVGDHGLPPRVSVPSLPVESVRASETQGEVGLATSRAARATPHDEGALSIAPHSLPFQAKGNVTRERQRVSIDGDAYALLENHGIHYRLFQGNLIWLNCDDDDVPARRGCTAYHAAYGQEAGLP